MRADGLAQLLKAKKHWPTEEQRANVEDGPENLVGVVFKRVQMTQVVEHLTSVGERWTRGGAERR